MSSYQDVYNLLISALQQFWDIIYYFFSTILTNITEFVNEFVSILLLVLLL